MFESDYKHFSFRCDSIAVHRKCVVPTLDCTLLLMRILLDWRVVHRYSSQKECPMGVVVAVHHIILWGIPV